MGGGLNLSPRAEWSPTARSRRADPPEHRCAKCFGPFGKSAIPCPNEPKAARPRTANEKTRDLYAEAAALNREGDNANE